MAGVSVSLSLCWYPGFWVLLSPGISTGEESGKQKHLPQQKNRNIKAGYAGFYEIKKEEENDHGIYEGKSKNSLLQ